MATLVEYVLCYSSAFFLGMIVGVFIMIAIDYVRENN